MIKYVYLHIDALFQLTAYLICWCLKSCIFLTCLKWRFAFTCDPCANILCCHGVHFRVIKLVSRRWFRRSLSAWPNTGQRCYHLFGSNSGTHGRNCNSMVNTFIWSPAYQQSYDETIPQKKTKSTTVPYKDINIKISCAHFNTSHFLFLYKKWYKMNSKIIIWVYTLVHKFLICIYTWRLL